MDVRFLETAKAEFWEAAAYYEHEQEGLGASLLAKSPRPSTGLSIIRMHGVRYLRGRDSVEPTDFRMLSFIR